MRKPISSWPKLTLFVSICVGLLTACPSDDGGGTADSGNDGGMDDGASSTSNPATSAADSDASGMSGDGGSMGDGGSGGEACEPAADDTECDTCVKQMCCAQAAACLEDTTCTCFQECAAGNPAPLPCFEECMADAQTGPTADVVMCTTMNCASECVPTNTSG